MGNTNQIEIADLSVNHLKDLQKLYKVVFKVQKTELYFQNKFGLKDPAFQDFSKVAICNGHVIGFMGATMQPFRNNQKQIKAVSFCDFILYKEYRKQGILEKLYQALIEDKRINEIDLLYAIQSEQTHKVSRRWGWLDFSQFSRFHIVGCNKYLSGLVRKINSPKVIFSRFKKLSSTYHKRIIFNKPNHSSDYKHLYLDPYFNTKQDGFHCDLNIAGCELHVAYAHHLTIGFIRFNEDANPALMIDTLSKLLKKAYVFEAVIHVQSNLIESEVLKEFITEQASYRVSGKWMRNEANLPISLNFMDMDTF